ncbi:MAG TPA: hypothetical protein VK158_04095 [Acidobacteriota bacterium]|nr:hypothetical protein [Acidobacteriota bacterium]
MALKCTVCEIPATLYIKGTSTAYCEEHAREFFSDTSYLAKVEEEVKALKDVIDANDTQEDS